MPTTVAAAATVPPPGSPSIIVIATNIGNGSGATETGLKAIYVAGIVIGTIAILVSLLSVLGCILLIRRNRQKGRQWPHFSSGLASNKGSSPISTADTIKVDLEASTNGERGNTASPPIKKRSKSRWPNYYRVSPPPHMLLFPFRRSSGQQQSDGKQVGVSSRPATATERQPLTRLKISNPIPIIDSPLKQHPVNMHPFPRKSKGKARADPKPPSPSLRSPLRPARLDHAAFNMESVAQSSGAAEAGPSSSAQSVVTKPRHAPVDGVSVASVPSSSKAPSLAKSPGRSKAVAAPHSTSKTRGHGHARYDSATDIDISEDEHSSHSQRSASSSHKKSKVQKATMTGNGDRSPIFDLKYPEIPLASNVRSSSPKGILPNSTPELPAESSAPPSADRDSSLASGPLRNQRSRPALLKLPASSASTPPITPTGFSSAATRIPTPFAPPHAPSAVMVPSPANITGTSLMYYNDPSQQKAIAALENRHVETWPSDSSSSRRQRKQEQQQQQQRSRAKGRRGHRRQLEDISGNGNSVSNGAKTKRRSDLPQTDVYDFF